MSGSSATLRTLPLRDALDVTWWHLIEGDPSQADRIRQAFTGIATMSPDADGAEVASSPAMVDDLNAMRAQMGLGAVKAANPRAAAADGKSEVDELLEAMGRPRSLRLPPPAP